MEKGSDILVVEDDLDLSELICELLRSEGFRPRAAHTGTEALREVDKNTPDAIVLDVMLPELNGFEVCQKLKFRRETNAIPIVMLTALDTAKARQNGLRVGANRYLTKPFEPGELIVSVKQVLAHQRQLQAGKTHTSIELQMQSDDRRFEQLHDMLSELFRLTPLSNEEVDRIRYAVLEMIENAREWGNRGKYDLLVKITYEVAPDFLKFVISDEGPGFDRNNLPHAAKEEDPVSHLDIRESLGLRIGGFGIMTAKGLVDKLEYNDAGNQVTLIKYFDGHA